MPRKILFQHIPKTAGTALIGHASAHFGARVCPARYDYQLDDAMMLDEATTFYQGHFSLAVVSRFRVLHPDAFIFTLVRHPYARTLSQFFNWTDRGRVLRELDIHASDADPHSARLRRKFETTIFDMSLDDFLTSDDPDVRQVVNNLQSQYLTGLEAPDHVRFNRAPINAAVFYDFIGLPELYGPCLRIAEAMCGLPSGTLGGDERVNTNDHAKTGGRYRISPRQLALIERCNTYDMALFHVCHSLLLARHADMLPRSALDVAAIIEWPILGERGHRALAMA